MTRTENPLLTIEATIAAHGAWRVLSAALLAILMRRRDRAPPGDAAELGDHLRRDLGLPPARPRLAVERIPPFRPPV